MSAWKCIGVCAVVWMMATAGSATAAESVVANAGFESGKDGTPDSWSPFGKHVAWEKGFARGGIYSGKASGENDGAPNFTGFLQNFDAKAGEEWVAGVWILQTEEDPLQGKCEAFVKVEFYNAKGEFIDAQESADRATAGSLVGTYIHSGVSHVAPMGTASVRLVAMFAQFDGKSKGTVYFDDADLHLADQK